VPGGRTYTAGRFLLALDGVACGFVKGVEGGAIAAEVVKEAIGSTYYAQKHLGAIRFEELTLGIDLSLDQRVYQWLADTLAGKFVRRDGSIVALDNQLKPVSEREFVRSLLSEVTFPALDASSKEPAYLTIKLAPELTRSKAGSGASGKGVSTKAKAWQSQNFKLEIDELDCTKVAKVDSFTITQKVATDQIGDARGRRKQPASLEVSNLRITLAESSAKTWTSWFDAFVIKGNNSPEHERNGKLSFLAADRKTVLGEVSFFNLGIFRLEPEPRSAGVEQVARVHADLYCERMELKIG
jgi:hypothetical protein